MTYIDMKTIHGLSHEKTVKKSNGCHDNELGARVLLSV